MKADDLLDMTESKKISLSLPSLRIDNFSLELMNKVQSEIDFNNKLHEELTGKNPSNDDSNEETVKTIKRFMPDGSIMFVTLKDGEVVDMHKKKPHLVAVADPSAPKTPSGQTAVTLKVKPQLDLFSLLM